MRSLLSHPRLNVKNLNEIVRALERQPDLLSADQDELTAASAGYFESVRHEEQVLRRDGTFFHWVFADPNLLLQRTLRECPNLAELYAQKLTERPCDVDNPWSLIVVFDALLAYDDAKHDFQAHGVNTPDAADFFREMSYSYWRVHRVLSWNYQTRKLPFLVGLSMADVVPRRRWRAGPHHPALPPPPPPPPPPHSSSSSTVEFGECVQTSSWASQALTDPMSAQLCLCSFCTVPHSPTLRCSVCRVEGCALVIHLIPGNDHDELLCRRCGR